MNKQRIPSRLMTKGAPAEKHTRTIVCGRGHSGNRSLYDATLGYAECAGCGSFYTVEQVTEAEGRAGQNGCAHLYDSGRLDPHTLRSRDCAVVSA